MQLRYDEHKRKECIDTFNGSEKRNIKRNTENMFPSHKEVWYTERSGIRRVKEHYEYIRFIK